MVSDLTQQTVDSGGGDIADIPSPPPPDLSLGGGNVPGGPGLNTSTPHTRSGARYGTQPEEEEEAPPDLSQHLPNEPAAPGPRERCMVFNIENGRRIKITIEVL